MARRQWCTDSRLWALSAGAVFVPLGFVDLLGGTGKAEYSLWAYLQLILEGGYNTRALVLALAVQGLFLAVPAMAVGWLVQAVSVMCGVRLTGRPDRQQALDYKEPEAAEPLYGPIRMNKDSDSGRVAGDDVAS